MTIRTPTWNSLLHKLDEMLDKRLRHRQAQRSNQEKTKHYDLLDPL